MNNSLAIKAVLGLFLILAVSISFFVLRDSKVSHTAKNDQSAVNSGSVNIKNKTEENHNKQDDSRASVTPVNTNSALAIYTNKKYGFELQYPKDWLTKADFLSCPKLDAIDSKISGSKATICSINFTSSKEEFIVTINVHFQSNVVSTEKYLALNKEASSYEKQTFLLGSNNFIGFKQGVINGNYFGPYYIAKNHAVFEITGRFGSSTKPTDDQQKIYSDIVKNMLSAWRFE